MVYSTSCQKPQIKAMSEFEIKFVLDIKFHETDFGYVIRMKNFGIDNTSFCIFYLYLSNLT